MPRSNEKLLQLRFKGNEQLLYSELVRIALQYREDGENPKGAVNRLVKLVMLEFVEQTRASEQGEKEDKNEAE